MKTSFSTDKPRLGTESARRDNGIAKKTNTGTNTGQYTDSHRQRDNETERNRESKKRQLTHCLSQFVQHL